MTARVNRLLVERAQRALGEEATVTSATVSYAGLHPAALLAVVVGGAVGIVLVLGLTTGVLFVPGAIPMLAVRYYAGKPRVVATTERGLALFNMSFWSGRPTDVLARTAYPPPGRPSQGSWTQVDFGRERVWVRLGRLIPPGLPA